MSDELIFSDSGNDILVVADFMQISATFTDK